MSSTTTINLFPLLHDIDGDGFWAGYLGAPAVSGTSFALFVRKTSTGARTVVLAGSCWAISIALVWRKAWVTCRVMAVEGTSV